MRSKSDKTFHLVIAVIAILVTIVSGASIVYQFIPFTHVLAGAGSA